MVRLLRANLIDPGGAQPVRRDAAARVHAAQVRRPHPRHRAAQPDRPTRRRERARATCSASSCRNRALPAARLRSRQEAAAAFDADPSVVGLILHKHGIFTFGGDAREAYERMIEMVTIAEARPARAGKVFSRRRTAAARSRAGRGRAAHPRRVSRARRRGRRRLAAAGAGVSPQRRECSHSSTARTSRATRRPASSRRTTPSAPRRWPLIVAAPVDGALDDFKRAARAAVEQYVARYRAYFERHNAPFRQHPDDGRSPAPRRAGAGARPVRARRHQARRHHRRRPRRERHRGHHRRGGDRHASSRSAKPTCSIANTGRWSAPSSARRSACR